MKGSSTPRPSTADVEAWLCERIAKKLKLKEVAPDAPLSECGLDSMSAMRILDALEQYLGEKLPPTILFEYPTARAVAHAAVHRAAAACEEYAAPDADAY